MNAFLLVADQNNEVLMKKHEYPNATNTDGYQNNTRGRGCGHGRGRGLGYFGHGKGNNRGRGQKRNNYQSLQRNNIHTQEKAKVARHDVGTS
uniref:Uncharacterized protein n=1 Tax=Lactuca sativa TaxID=4236 RepID=A0A9R1UVH6_LACSA|nr:hypothetical protein LSAT_V11C800423870 [Lactuca sativa]